MTKWKPILRDDVEFDDYLLPESAGDLWEDEVFDVVQEQLPRPDSKGAPCSCSRLMMNSTLSTTTYI